MGLVQLVYTSRMTQPLDRDAIERIATRAHRANRLQDISGLLIVGNGSFIQLLEGDPIKVIRLYDKIAADQRHTSVERLYFEEARERMFASWAMGLLNLNVPEKPLDLSQVRALTLMQDKWSSVLEGSVIAVEMLKRFRAVAA